MTARKRRSPALCAVLLLAYAGFGLFVMTILSGGQR